LERNSNCSPCHDDNSHCCAKKVCREREPEPEREAEQPVYEPEFVPLEDADATDDEHGSVVVPEVEDDDVHEPVLIEDNDQNDGDLDEIVTDDVDAEDES
jgi:hypothetical protein